MSGTLEYVGSAVGAPSGGDLIFTPPIGIVDNDLMVVVFTESLWDDDFLMGQPPLPGVSFPGDWDEITPLNTMKAYQKPYASDGPYTFTVTWADTNDHIAVMYVWHCPEGPTEYVSIRAIPGPTGGYGAGNPTLNYIHTGNGEASRIAAWRGHSRNGSQPSLATTNDDGKFTLDVVSSDDAAGLWLQITDTVAQFYSSWTHTPSELITGGLNDIGYYYSTIVIYVGNPGGPYAEVVATVAEELFGTDGTLLSGKHGARGGSSPGIPVTVEFDYTFQRGASLDWGGVPIDQWEVYYDFPSPTPNWGDGDVVGNDLDVPVDPTVNTDTHDYDAIGDARGGGWFLSGTVVVRLLDVLGASAVDSFEVWTRTVASPRLQSPVLRLLKVSAEELPYQLHNGML